MNFGFKNVLIKKIVNRRELWENNVFLKKNSKNSLRLNQFENLYEVKTSLYEFVINKK